MGSEPAFEVPEDELRTFLDAGYGAFSGSELEWAELTFSATRARWVSNETWHPEQKGWFDDDGRYHLCVPFSNPTELVMDILRHAPEVKVDAPDSLKKLFKSKLLSALSNC
jgi:predicted DNA-binding transcriptional regulator YafY